jgi:chromosome partitioning protein
MHTIAMVSRKGGSGKSTLAIALAVAGMEAGHAVCVLDADPLGTVSNWRGRRTAARPTVEAIHDGSALFERVSELARGDVTLTIVDTAGGWNDASREAMAAADFCLIPVRPSPTDIEAAAPTLAAVRESGKPFAFVLNQVQAHSARLNPAAGSLGERAIALEIANVLALPAIVQRNDQQDALGMGLGITEYAPRGKSAKEVRELWHWVWARLNCASQPDAQAPAHTALPPAPWDSLPPSVERAPTMSGAPASQVFLAADCSCNPADLVVQTTPRRMASLTPRSKIKGWLLDMWHETLPPEAITF